MPKRRPTASGTTRQPSRWSVTRTPFARLTTTQPIASRLRSAWRAERQLQKGLYDWPGGLGRRRSDRTSGVVTTVDLQRHRRPPPSAHRRSPPLGLALIAAATPRPGGWAGLDQDLVRRRVAARSRPPPAHVVDGLGQLSECLRAAQSTDDWCQGTEVIE